MRAVVLGAGVGGLAAALELSGRGVDVLVLEGADRVGGKMRQSVRGIDVGPTVLTMRWVFDELFRGLGEHLEDWVRLRSAEVIARHAFADGSTLDLFTELERGVEAVRRFAGDAEAEGYRRFSAYARRIYEAVEGPFIRGPRPTARSLAFAHGLEGLARLTRIDATRSMWGALEGFFRDPRLLQLFGRYATYVGSSPLLAPATLNLVAHVERTGVSYVDGGMARLAEGMAALLSARGAGLRLGAHVASIEVEGGAVRAVRLASGERIACELVVANCDVSALAEGALGAEVRRGLRATPERERSLSAITWAVEARAADFPLVRHNVFFSPDYPRELAELFDERRAPTEPTVYVCAQDRGDAPSPAASPERLLVLSCAPARDRAWRDEEIDRCEQATFDRLRQAGLRLEIVSRERASPEDFARRFPHTRGALYGPAATGMMSPLSREGARTRTRGLYLAGGSVHPGPGVPMAALSGQRAAEAVIEDHPSMSRSRSAATRGGTRTSSRTTAPSA